MPKSKNPKLFIHLDLLKPQGNPEKLANRLIRWLFSTGRFIFIFVEALVLSTFILRFKLDADLAAKKEAIEEQIPYIESLKPYEVLIRQTQLKLSTINALIVNTPDYSQILKKIADQTPAGIKISTINLEKDVGKVNVQISAQSQNNNDLLNFIAGLKEDTYFSDVKLVGIGLEQNTLRFTVSLSAKISNPGEKSL